MSGSAAGAHGGIDLENITTGVNPKSRAAAKELPEELKKLLSGARPWPCVCAREGGGGGEREREGR